MKRLALSALLAEVAELRERLESAEARIAELEKAHEALLTTLAPSKSSWVQHVYRNARAYFETLRGEAPKA